MSSQFLDHDRAGAALADETHGPAQRPHRRFRRRFIGRMHQGDGVVRHQLLTQADDLRQADAMIDAVAREVDRARVDRRIAIVAIAASEQRRP